VTAAETPFRFFCDWNGGEKGTNPSLGPIGRIILLGDNIELLP
jgi:hypothetical protein